nr:bifunctional 4-hydroxy-2-oxoglutarate aldolase/2-dehydro-3-deoxy-phosphogluconate aldolase [Cytophagales bacterium]
MFSWERFHAVPLVGIARGLPARQMDNLAAAYIAAGLTNLEVTLNTDGAADIIRRLAQQHGDSLNVGAGTVLTIKDLDIALAAGASFIVTPVLNEGVAQGVPVFPGAYTPTEIYRAWSLGADMVKVFPVGQLGPGYIREVLAPLNGLRLMPTGGVTLANCAAFFEAGAQALGLGGGLFPKHLLQAEDWAGL